MLSSELTKEMKMGLSNYKYACIDSSPLSNYIMSPLLDQVVKVFPLWMAPNLMTLLGMLATIAHYLLLTYYNPSFAQPYIVPAWAWLLTSVLIAVAYTLDGIDGKQARRTASSSPLGELFDHGCDSWAVVFITSSAMALLAGSQPPVMIIFFAEWAVLLAFIISQWERHIIGVLYLPWAYDVVQLVLTIIFVLAYAYSPSIFNAPLVMGISTVNFFEFCLCFSVVVQLAITAYNLNAPDDPTSQKPVAVWHRGIGWWPALSPFLPTCLALASSLVWMLASPTDIMARQPRLFIYCFATLESHVICELMITSLCRVPLPINNWLVNLYALAVALVVLQSSSSITTTTTTNGLVMDLDLYLLIFLSIVITLVHVYQSTMRARSIAAHLQIDVFRIKSSSDSS